ncbi:MAG: ABC transporter permease [Lachnospiraceae bacterium]|nr:ABC transporter permease [Lachnospiraceae bacterium]
MGKNKKVEKTLYNTFLKVLAPVLLVLIWHVASVAGLTNANILPSPTRVVETLIKLISNGKLGKNLLVSAIRVLQGFSVGTLLGIILGVLMGLSKTLNRILNSLVNIFRPIPMIAWIPLLILWLGIGEESKIAVIIIGTLWPVLLNTISGILSVDKKLLEVAQIMEKSRSQILLSVILPSAWPSIITGIRLGIGTAWTCVVAAEMIAAASGIGYMITYARELSQPDVVLVGVFTIGVVGLLIDFIIMRIQKRLLRWKYVQQGK